jgi:CubicO group peptidase (beta-lactamase class C family)
MNHHRFVSFVTHRARHRRGFPLALLAIVALLAMPLVGCSTHRAAADAPYWPTKGWRTSSPEAQGMDGARLDEMLADIRRQSTPLYSLLVIRNGYMVSETYFRGDDAGTRRELYSVTKSVVATLVGIAVDRGDMADLDAPVLGCFPERTFAHTDDLKEAMTLRHLLTMTSGLDWGEGDSTYRAMYMSGDWVRYVLDIPMRQAPGERFVYCSGCSHLLAAIVQQRAQGNLEDYARRHLFGPLGIKSFKWDRDSAGIPIGGWGLQLTPRDMARLGYLYLRRGEWEGKQVVSAGWIDAATQRHVATDGALGYGYQWWIYPDHGAYVALGRYGQTIFVAPEHDLVVVTTARIEGGHEAIFRLIDEYIVPAAGNVVQ